jgi:hypothetical protein
MVANSFMKPLQGSLFRKLRKIILNLPDEYIMKTSDMNDENKLTNAAASQECVGTKISYADVVRGIAKRSSQGYAAVRQSTVSGKR